LLKRWEEPAGPRSLTVMELSEDLDNMTKVASAIKSSSSGGGGATTPKKGGAMAKKKMLQVDEVLALVIGSLLAATL
jgi:hypothetical protein